jgi:cytochrome c oxidase cbb3-type subunit 3
MAGTAISAAAGGTSAESTPVGPIPGGVQLIHYRTNPLAGDPVALQDGRRLFNWYNGSGCHGGHAGGGMGPSFRDQVWLYGDRDDQIFDSIAQGRGQGMPAWGSKIPQTQI